MLDRLDATLASQRRFAASHELRTLLATIRAELDPGRREPRQFHYRGD